MAGERGVRWGGRAGVGWVGRSLPRQALLRRDATGRVGLDHALADGPRVVGVPAKRARSRARARRRWGALVPLRSTLLLPFRCCGCIPCCWCTCCVASSLFSLIAFGPAWDPLRPVSTPPRPCRMTVHCVGQIVHWLSMSGGAGGPEPWRDMTVLHAFAASPSRTCLAPWTCSSARSWPQPRRRFTGAATINSAVSKGVGLPTSMRCALRKCHTPATRRPPYVFRWCVTDKTDGPDKIFFSEQPRQGV